MTISSGVYANEVFRRLADENLPSYVLIPSPHPLGLLTSFRMRLAVELATRLGDAAYLDAVGVLEMISHSPEDRQFYDARQKFIHDEEGRLLYTAQLNDATVSD